MPKNIGDTRGAARAISGLPSISASDSPAAGLFELSQRRIRWSLCRSSKYGCTINPGEPFRTALCQSRYLT